MRARCERELSLSGQHIFYERQLPQLAPYSDIPKGSKTRTELEGIKHIIMKVVFIPWFALIIIGRGGGISPHSGLTLCCCWGKYTSFIAEQKEQKPFEEFLSYYIT